jgi:hypothetical protein
MKTLQELEQLNETVLSIKANYLIDAVIKTKRSLTIEIKKDMIHIWYLGNLFSVYDSSVAIPLNFHLPLKEVIDELKKELSFILEEYSKIKKEYLTERDDKEIKIKRFNLKVLITNLAFDMAKDEAFREDLVTKETDLFMKNKENEMFYQKWFQPIFDRWYDYFDNQFREAINDL